MRLGSSSTENKNKLVGTPFFRVPLTIALVYTLAGFLWIMFSDILVERLAANEPTYHALQTLKGWFFVAETASYSDSAPMLLSIKSTSFGAVGALINFVVAYVVSNATEEPPAEVQDLVESIRIPRGAGAATGH